MNKAKMCENDIIVVFKFVRIRSTKWRRTCTVQKVVKMESVVSLFLYIREQFENLSRPYHNLYFW